MAPAGGRPAVYAEGAPGAVLEDGLAVTNPGSEPLTVRLRTADAGTTRTDARAPRPGPDPLITLATRGITVPPRTRADIPFSVTVPARAVPGDQPTSITVSAAGREVRVPVHLRVTGPALAALTVEDVSVTRGGTIRYTLVNRGNTTLRPKVTITADGLLGEVLRRTPRALPAELAPARRVTLTERWPDPPSLDSVDVRVEATAGAEVRGRGTASATFVPWLPVSAAAALLAAAAGALRFAVRRHPGRRPSEPSGSARRMKDPRSGA
ncbi:hypothetical protein [Streptomyces sp. NPDC020965]|uniref:hypothetical protein n=1 Tax=Streptomyces sp. NPDC020965 TaxID=3365105 RepID=UPI003794FC46